MTSQSRSLLGAQVFLFQAEGEEEEEVVDLSPAVATVLLAVATVHLAGQLVEKVGGTVEDIFPGLSNIRYAFTLPR